MSSNIVGGLPIAQEEEFRSFREAGVNNVYVCKTFSGQVPKDSGGRCEIALNIIVVIVVVVGGFA